MDTYPTCSFVVGKGTNRRLMGWGGGGHFFTLVGKWTNSRFVGWGRDHVVVISGQGDILSLLVSGQIVGLWDGGPCAKAYGKWSNGR